MTHRLLRTAVGVAALLTVAALGAGSASAAPVVPAVPAAFPSYGITTGDVTGDGLVDRLAVESSRNADGVRVCTALVKAGLPGGGSAYPRRIRLPVQGLQVPNSIQGCPDLFVVLRGPTPAQNRLATNWGTFAPAGGASVQIFDLTGTGTIARYDSGFFGQSNPSGGISTADLDGDGWGDIYQQGTDQGSGVDSWIRRGTTWAPFYSSGGTPAAGAQIVDLDHGPGTDMLVSTASYTDTALVDAVDGRTGRVQRLATGSDHPDLDVYAFRTELVDLDHNAYLDIAVTPISHSGNAVPPLYFLNRSQNGRWSFVPTTVGGAAAG